MLAAAGTQDGVVAKYAADGSLLWARRAGGAAGSVRADAVAALPDGGVLLCGDLQGTVRFGEGEAGVTWLVANGSNDAFLAGYAATGTLAWVKPVGGAGDDVAKAMAVFAGGRVQVVGGVTTGALFGQGEPMATPVVTAGNRDAFLAQYGCFAFVNAGTLVVAGSPTGHGLCSPCDYGTHVLALGSTATLSVPRLLDHGNGTQYWCAGWAGSGSVPGSGTGVTVNLVFTNNSVLSWDWRTRYLLTVASGTGGRTAASNGWYAAGTQANVSALASNGWRFAGWTGSVPSIATNDNPLVLAMDQARTVTARFQHVADPAVIDNVGGVSNLMAASARVNGSLISDGGGATAVTIYWGDTDGGASVPAWTSAVSLGVQGVGPFATLLTGLTSNHTYYYRCAASNFAGLVWAPATVAFTTLLANPPTNRLVLSASTLTNRVGQQESAASLTFDAWSGMGDAMAFTNSVDVGWMRVAPVTGVSTGDHRTATVLFNTIAMAAGTYTGRVTVVASGVTNSPQTIAVYLVVTNGPGSSRVAGWRYERENPAGQAYYPFGSTTRTVNGLWERFVIAGITNGTVLTGDVNGDGFLEVVHQASDKLEIYSHDGQLLSQVSLPVTACRLAMIEDVNGDGTNDIAIAVCGSSSATQCFFYAGNGAPIKTLQTARIPDSAGQMIPKAVLANGDIVVAHDSGLVTDPRGIAVYAGTNGVERWFYHIGPREQISSVADIDGDGKAEFVWASAATHNGGAGDGFNHDGTLTTDGDLWLIVVDEDGNEHVSAMYPPSGDGSASHTFVDLNRDGCMETLGFERHTSAYSGASRVRRFDTQGQIVRTFDGPTNAAWSMAVGDINGDGYPEVVAGTDAGALYVLDRDLNLLASTNISLAVQFIGDVNGDGTNEIVVTDQAGTVRVLDAQLRQLIAVTNLGTTAIASDLDRNGRLDILCLTSTGLHVFEGALATSRLVMSRTALTNASAVATNAVPQSFDVWSEDSTNAMAYGISDDAAWLTITPTNGTSRGERDTMTVTYGTAGLTAGVYSATITVNAPGASNALQTISVSLAVTNLPPVPPVVDNTGASGITTNTAMLGGVLISTGRASTTVCAYWGPADGGTTTGLWAHCVALGQLGVGAFSTNITGLTAGTSYFYRCWASNVAGTAWAPASVAFQAAAAVRLVTSGWPTPHGVPMPYGYGTNSVQTGLVVTNRIDGLADSAGGTRYACVGWTGSGNVPASGSGTSVVVTLTADSTLAWNWQAQRLLTVTSSAGGSVTGSNGWYVNGTPVVLTATASNNYTFMGWTGDVPAANTNDNPLTLTMDQARAANALFIVNDVLTNYWTGVAGSDWFNPLNWSLGTVPAAGRHARIDSTSPNTAAVTLNGATPALASFTIASRTLVFTNWSTLLRATNVAVRSGGVLTLPPAFAASRMSNCVHVACSAFTVDAGGWVNADGRGYVGGSNTTSAAGPGKGIYSGYGSGAGYGGAGGSAANGLPGGAAYGLASLPLMPGSGGGGSASGPGGNGGGVVWIEATGVVTVNGAISANGTNSIVAGGGAGAGGSIAIACTRLDSGVSGILRASGGDSTGLGGAGGGGGVAVVYGAPPVTARGRFVVTGGAGSSTVIGDPGSLYFSGTSLFLTNISGMSGIVFVPGFTNWNVGSLGITNSLLGFGAEGFVLSVTNGVNVGAYGGLRLPAGSRFDSARGIAVNGIGSALSLGAGSLLTCGQDLILTNSGMMTVLAAPTNLPGTNCAALVRVAGNLVVGSACSLYPYSDPTNGGSVLFQVSNLTVAANGMVSADEHGYAGSATNVPGGGPGGGASADAGFGAGGAYGGRGGDSGSGQAGGAAYGVAAAPREPGSGGGSGSAGGWNAGGPGGGVVRVEAAGTVTLANNSRVTANGGAGRSVLGGGGAGGSIRLDCQTLAVGSANIVIAANGGEATTSAGSGGGGRIALSYRVGPTNWSSLRFSTGPGNPGVSSSAGSCGSLYLSEASVLSGGFSAAVANVGLYGPGFTNVTVGSLTVSNTTLGFGEAGMCLSVTGALTVSRGNLALPQSARVDCSSLSLYATGTLSVSGGSRVTCSGAAVVSNGSTLVVLSGATNLPGNDYGSLVSVGGDLTLSDRSRVCPVADAINGGTVLVKLRAMTVADAVSGFDADGAGYAGGAGLGIPGWGLGGGQSVSSWGGGGGHGGPGGAAQGGALGGSPYGSVISPMEPGRGGGGGYYPGGAGGGVIRIEAGGGVTLNGYLSANGRDAGGAYAGGGAGGSILLVCGRLTGNSNGQLRAAGGQGVSPGGGGGGGRIAIRHEGFSYAGSLSVTNGLGLYALPSAGAPSTGTIYQVDRLATIYVDMDATGTHDGTSWSNAFTDLNPALALAASNREIWVAEGRYVPGSQRTATFVLAPNTRLFGGFSGNETTRDQRDWRAHVTVLSGDINGDDAGFANNSDNAWHVITCTNSAVMADGIVVSGGNAAGSSAGGGALNLQGASNVVFRNCLLTNNAATAAGGAVEATGAAVLFDACDFAANVSVDAGGALDVRGGAVTLAGCRLVGNAAAIGGAFASSQAVMTVTQSRLLGNRATMRGGAVSADGGVADFANVAFGGNRAGTDGGALYFTGGAQGTVRCSTLVDNRAMNRAGAAFQASGNTIYEDVILWSNMSNLGSGGSLVVSGAGTACSFGYGDVQGGSGGFSTLAGGLLNVTGEVLNADPYFANEAGPDGVTGTLDDDFHLQSTAGRWTGAAWVKDGLTSPCVDAGNPADDWRQEPGPNGGRINLGCDANTVEASLSGVSVIGVGTTNVTAIGGKVVGRMLAAGGAVTRVHLYWGLKDGGVQAANWDSGVALGVQGLGPLTVDLSSLLPSTNYYYRFYATNALGDVWAPESGVFRTGSTVIYVDSAAAGAKDGTSWSNAFASLASALSVAGAGQQIWVAEGTYLPGTRRSDAFFLPEGVPVYGGFASGMTNAIQRDPAAHVTVLSGDIGVPGVYTDDCYHVVVGANTVCLDGVTVCGGYADGAAPDERGAGLYVGVDAGVVGTVTVSRCAFGANTAAGSGAGACLEARGDQSVISVAIGDTVFEGNSAMNGLGGGLSLRADDVLSVIDATVQDCRFVANVAGQGGGLSYRGQGVPFRLRMEGSEWVENAAVTGDGGGLSVVCTDAYGESGWLSNCVFAANSATARGGGALLDRFACPVLDCRFVDNHAGDRGGAACIRSQGSAAIGNCTVTGNQADDGGGFDLVEESPQLHHCLFAGNHAEGSEGRGGAVYVERTGLVNCRPGFLNCDFADNSAGVGGAFFGETSNGTAQVSLRNCILWGNGAAPVQMYSGASMTGDYNCAEGGMDGVGIITANPRFMDAQAGIWTAAGTYEAGEGKTVLRDADRVWNAGELAGKVLQPDTNRVEKYLVFTNDLQTVVVWGNLGASTLQGQPYRLLDYSLAATNSPCVDAGINVGFPYLGGAPDLGAFEWGCVLNVRVLLQGPYDTNRHAMVKSLGEHGYLPRVAPYMADTRQATAIPSNAVDWVLIELLTTNGVSAAAQSVWLDVDGHILSDDGSLGVLAKAGAAGPYYVVAKHRNHLAICSAKPVLLSGAAVSVDLTVSPSIFGGAGAALELEPGTWGMAAGDADGDGLILAVDASIQQSQMGRSGYLRGDFDLDGVVSAADRDQCWSPNQGRRSAASNAAVVLTGALEVVPSRLTMLSGGSNEFAVAGATTNVYWAFVVNASGAQLASSTATDIVYTAGLTSGCIDTVEAWTPDNAMGRVQVNVIGEADVSAAGRAVVIAGRKGPADGVWPSTDYLADTAYSTLRYRGYARDHIRYLSPVTNEDVDGNGLLDDIAAQTTLANVGWTFTNWCANPGRLFVYLVDHGGLVSTNGYFRLNENEELSARQLGDWLNALQDRYSNEVVVVIDCCYAGSFVNALSCTGTAKHIVIAACDANQPTYFVAGGLVSFSDAFFSGVLRGLNVEDCFIQAKSAVSAYQNSQMQDNGGGHYGAQISVGASFVAGRDAPQISQVSGNQVLTSTTRVTLWASVLSLYDVSRVWCQVVPPGHNPNPDNPVDDIPEVELTWNPASGRYEANYGGFTQAGRYKVVFYAKDKWNSVSLPVQSFITQGGFDERVILVAGGTTNDSGWLAVSNMADMAYHAFQARWIGDAGIEFLTPVVGDGRSDGRPTLANLAAAITNWAASADKLTVYLIGDGSNGVFRLNNSEALTSTALGQWLDAFQVERRDAIVVMDFGGSGSFVTNLVAPSGRSRLCLASTQAGKTSCRAANGLMSFSRFLLSDVVSGLDLGDAFSRVTRTTGGSGSRLVRSGAREAMRFATRNRQIPLLDMNGNGVTEAPELTFAQATYIGSAFMTGAETPIIGNVTPDTLLTNDTTFVLWASEVTDMDGISNVWCVITPPDYDGQSELPSVPLAWTNGRYEVVYTNFTRGGTYSCTFFASDNTGEISSSMQCSIMKPDAFEDDNTPANAGAITLDVPQARNFHRAGDEDWVRFYAVTDFVYTIETFQFGTNVDTVLDVYRAAADGSLEPVAHVNDAGPGEDEGESLWLPAEEGVPLTPGLYYVRVSPADPSQYGLGTEYELQVSIDVGGGTLVVIAGNVLDGSQAPPGAKAIVDGTLQQDFNGLTSVSFPGLPAGDHTVVVAVPGGYRMQDDPTQPNQATNATAAFYGNPQKVTIDANAFGVAYAVFLVYPYVTVDTNTVVRDGWTRGPVPGATIDFTARSGVLSNVVYRGYPQGASYGSRWASRTDGTFPTDVILPLADYDLTLNRPGYAPIIVPRAIVNGVPGRNLAFSDVMVVPTNKARLWVTSTLNAVAPSIGTNIYDLGAVVTCVVAQATQESGSTQYVCTGWTGDGSVTPVGSTTSTAVRLAGDSSICWQWQQRLRLDTAVAGGQGAITAAAGWQGTGSNVTLTASASPYYHFLSWAGGTNYCAMNGSRITVTMDEARQIMAIFEANLAPAGTPEWWLAQHGLTNRAFEIEEMDDVDHDGHAAWEEWIAGTDPTNAASVFHASSLISADSTSVGVTWSVVTGRAYRVSACDDLGTDAPVWTQVSGPLGVSNGTSWLQWTDPTAAGQHHRYYRLEVQLP